MKSNTGNRFEKHPKLTIFILFLFVLAMLELFFRLVFPAGYGIFPSEYNSLYYKGYKSNVEFTTTPSQYDSFDPVVNHINSIGIRGPEIKKKSTYRVLNVGDSFVQADEVEFKDTFGEILNARSKGQMEFISHGFSSWSPTLIFSWLHHVGMTIKPDEVNLFLCVNDFFRDKVYKRTDQYYRRFAVYEGKIPVRYSIKDAKRVLLVPESVKNVLRKSMLYRVVSRSLFVAVHDLILKNQDKTTKSVPHELKMLGDAPENWDLDLKENVDKTIGVVVALAEYLKERNVKFRVFLVPLGFAWADETIQGKKSPAYQWPEDYVVSQAGIEGYLKDAFNREGITFLTFSDKFDQAKRLKPGALLFHEFDGHWNKFGHRVVADIMTEMYNGEKAVKKKE